MPVRPATDRMREAVYSSIGPAIADSRVLDLFAGTGAYGLEALSRGAKEVVFIESSRKIAKILSENRKTVDKSKGSHSQSTLLVRDIRRHGLSMSERFDFIFADPPYARDEETLADLVSLIENERLAATVAPDGLLILESFTKSPLPESSLWTVEKEKKYGKTRVSFLTPVA